MFQDRPDDSDAEEGDDGKAEKHCRRQQWQGDWILFYCHQCEL